MDTTVVLIILICLFIVLVCFAYIVTLSGPAPEDRKTYTIQVDESKNISIKTPDGAIKLDYIFLQDGTRKSDNELLPDFEDTTPTPEQSDDILFWNKIAAFDSLPANERADVILKMKALGYVRADSVDHFDINTNGAVKKEDEFDDIIGGTAKKEKESEKPKEDDKPGFESDANKFADTVGKEDGEETSEDEENTDSNGNFDNENAFREHSFSSEDDEHIS